MHLCFKMIFKIIIMYQLYLLIRLTSALLSVGVNFPH